MRAVSLHWVGFSAAAAVAVACGGEEGLTADQLNDKMPSVTVDPMPSGGTDAQATSTPSPTATTGGPATDSPAMSVGGATGTGSAPPSGAPTATASAPVGPGTTAAPPGPEPDMEPEGPVGGGGAPPMPPTTGGAGIDPTPEPVASGGMGSTGVAGAPPMVEPVPEPVVPVCEGPYCPRTGSFKMLAYSKTGGFRHTDSINSGKVMLQEIADEQGFEVSFTETNDEITAEGLLQYEIVFFMNSTGDIFNNNEQQIYEDWMTTQNGAFGGVHSATDTENGWAFYSEVTGQYYDLHETCCVEANIQWEDASLDFVAVQGLPNPWRRSEEWYYFNKSGEWSTKTGFTILSRVTSSNNTRPVSYIREWSNFRSFYTSLGHQGSVFEDDNVKRHVAAGIMWAVRREALLQ